MNVTQQPVFHHHVRAGFHVEIAAAWQCCNEKIRFILFTGDRIKIRYRTASPVHLHGFAGLVSDTYCCFGNMRPTAVFVAELRAHIRFFAVCIRRFAAVFLLEQRECHALFRQLTVDVLVIDDGIGCGAAVPAFVQKLLKHLVGYVIIKRTSDVQFLCAVKY